MAAGIFHDYIEQGATYQKQFTVKVKGGLPINLSAYQVRFQMRIPGLVDNGMLFVSRDSADGGDFPDADLANGRFYLVLGADVTRSLPLNTYKYTLEIYNPSDATDVLRLLEGTLQVRSTSIWLS